MKDIHRIKGKGWKMIFHANKNEKAKINGSIYHIYELEELISSKMCIYYPKQFIDSMQSLLKYQ